MPHANFIHLRIHSAYSLSEGAIKIPEIAELCVRERMPAVAVADTSNLFGALEFSTVCAERGIQPIIGCQINLTNSDPTSIGEGSATDQLVLLVQDQSGYANLLKLVSASYLNAGIGMPPQIDLGALAKRNSG